MPYSYNYKAKFWCPDQEKHNLRIVCPDLDFYRNGWNLKVAKAYARLKEDLKNDEICSLTTNVKSQKVLPSNDTEYKISPVCIGIAHFHGTKNQIIELRGFQDNPISVSDSDTGNTLYFEIRDNRDELFTKKVWVHLLVNLTKLH